MIYKYFGISPERVSQEIEWGDWVCMLAIALDEDEKAMYTMYVEAGGKPAEWTWSNEDLAHRMGGVSRSFSSFDMDDRTPGKKTHGLSRDVEGAVKKLFGYKPLQKDTRVVRGSMHEAVKSMRLEEVTIPCDDQGNPVVPAGYVFIPSTHAAPTPVPQSTHDTTVASVSAGTTDPHNVPMVSVRDDPFLGLLNRIKKP